MAEPVSDEVKELARRAAEWVASPEGRLAMEESQRLAMAYSERLLRCQKIDWRDMHTPITI